MARQQLRLMVRVDVILIFVSVFRHQSHRETNLYYATSEPHDITKLPHLVHVLDVVVLEDAPDFALIVMDQQL